MLCPALPLVLAWGIDRSEALAVRFVVTLSSRKKAVEWAKGSER